MLSERIKENWPGSTQIRLFENENGTSGLKELQHRVNVFLARHMDNLKVLEIKLTATEPALGVKHYTVMVIYEVKGEIQEEE